MSAICGIDTASTRLDLVLLQEDEPRAVRWHQIPLGRNAIESAWRMREWLPGSRFWSHHGVRLVVIERPMGYRIKTVQAQVMVIGALLSRLPPDVDVLLPYPHLWKPAISLKGNATKEDVREWALEHGADSSWSQDACDALGLAWGALADGAQEHLKARAAA